MITFLIITGVLILLGLLGNQAAKKEKAKDAEMREIFRKAQEEERKNVQLAAEANERILEKYPADIKSLINELVEVGRKYPPDRQSASRYLNTARSSARDIGQSLYEKGGNELMLMAHAKVRAALGGVAARELEAAWGGIGEWLS